MTYRLRLPASVHGVLTILGGSFAVFFLLQRYPQQWSRAVENVSEQLFRTDSVAETGGLFGERFGWLLLFGFVFVLAVPYLVYGLRSAVDDAPWVPAVVYGWFFVALATL